MVEDTSNEESFGSINNGPETGSWYIVAIACYLGSIFTHDMNLFDEKCPQLWFFVFAYPFRVWITVLLHARRPKSTIRAVEMFPILMGILFGSIFSRSILIVATKLSSQLL